MRIINGTLKGRRFNVPGNIPTRPTTDFAKTGLFNILDNRIDFTETTALDLFHGTGSISLELASRECPQIVSVDNNYICHAFLKQTAHDFKLPIEVLKGDAIKYIQQLSGSFDLVFADPPYDWPHYTKLVNTLFERNSISPGGLLVVEHDDRHSFANNPHFIEERNYGKVHFSFLGNSLTA